jgi:hypothetical protein
VVAEALARCGLDFVILDCEHAETSRWAASSPSRRAVDAGGALPVIRVTACDASQIGGRSTAAPAVIVRVSRTRPPREPGLARRPARHTESAELRLWYGGRLRNDTLAAFVASGH